jgi:hypothetical protein
LKIDKLLLYNISIMSIWIFKGLVRFKEVFKKFS